MNNIGYVYMITSPTSRVYVGSTRNYYKRLIQYKNNNCKHQVKLYNSFVKYGVENHKFEVVWTGDINDMLKYECLIGTYYEVLNKGLNCSLPRYDEKYQYISEETRLKMSISAKKKIFSDEHRINIKLSLKGRKAPNKGKKHSIESKRQMSLSHSKKVFTEEHKNNIRKAKLGKVKNKISKDIMSL